MYAYIANRLLIREPAAVLEARECLIHDETSRGLGQARGEKQATDCTVEALHTFVLGLGRRGVIMLRITIVAGAALLVFEDSAHEFIVGVRGAHNFEAGGGR